MRILYTFAGGTGHFVPLIPVARASAEAGHTVGVAGRPGLASVIEVAGFTSVAGSQPDRGVDVPKRTPLLEPDPEREDRDFRDGFADRLARLRAAGLLEVMAEWKPDVVVCDQTDFGSMIAAERLGIPCASVIVLAAGTFPRPGLIDETLNRVRTDFGLPAQAPGHLILSPVPSGFRDFGAHTFRAHPIPFRAHPIPEVAQAEPIIYFTLGTIFNTESGDLFDRVLSGLKTLPVEVVVTTGQHIDPADFGPQPSNVHIERFIPQAAILPRCRAVVSHAGSGSVLGALEHGLPSVLLPMGADQPANAQRCQELGIAIVLDPTRATPAQIADATQSVLSDPSYRQKAQRLQAEIAAMPGPESTVALLERLIA